MKMRTFIRLKTPSKSIRGTFHARYISERERDPGREEPETRPLFTHDRDGLKYKAADRYLAGGEKKNARSNEIQHIIIAFNSHDARELQKLENAPADRAVADEDSRKDESSKIEHQDESSNLEHSPEAGKKLSRKDELAAIHRAQIAHDLPYAEAVRKMMRNLEERAGLSDLRYVMAVHRHTDKTHVHLLLRRECTDRSTGEKRMLHRLPETFLNGRDEHGRARAGLLDSSLSDALDTMIPRRQRPGRADNSNTVARSDRHTDEPARHVAPDDPGPRADELSPVHHPRRAEATPRSAADKNRPRFVTPRIARNEATAPDTVRHAPNEARTPAPTSNTESRSQASAGQPSNLQFLTTNLQPNLQLLKIEGPENTLRNDSHEEALKKSLAVRFAQNPQPGTTKELSAPGSSTKTHVTDSSAETTRAAEQKRSSPSRGR